MSNLGKADCSGGGDDQGRGAHRQVFPGSTSDVRSFAQVISSHKERFPIGRVIVVSRGDGVRGEPGASARTRAFLHRGGESFQLGRWPWRTRVFGR